MSTIENIPYICTLAFVCCLLQIKVQYIDFGNFEDVNPQDLVELPAELTMPKPFATKILLHGVRFITTKELEVCSFSFFLFHFKSIDLIFTSCSLQDVKHFN